jgi:hypothetical protein
MCFKPMDFGFGDASITVTDKGSPLHFAPTGTAKTLIEKGALVNAGPFADGLNCIEFTEKLKITARQVVSPLIG